VWDNDGAERRQDEEPVGRASLTIVIPDGEP
jgi:hypothetical protein